MKFKIETKVMIKRFYEVEATNKKQAVDKLFESEDGTRHFYIGCFKPEHEDKEFEEKVVGINGESFSPNDYRELSYE